MPNYTFAVHMIANISQAICEILTVVQVSAWPYSNGHGKLPPLMMKPIMPVSLSPSLSRKRAREKTIAARVSR